MLAPETRWPQWDAAPYFEADAARWEERIRTNPRHTGPGLKTVIENDRNEAARGARLLSFIAQIDLAQVGKYAAVIGLPETGLLAFFYAAEECPGPFDPLSRGSGQVIYTAGSAVEMPTPANIEEDQRFTICDLEFCGQWILPDYCFSIRQKPLDHVLMRGQIEFGILNEPYQELHRQLIGLPELPLHRVGGYPQLVQNEMQLQCQLASNGIYCGRSDDYKTPRALALKEGAADWTLLLQIDSDDAPGWMWGDAGRLYFWIKRQDLAKCDFSNVWSIMQCY